MSKRILIACEESQIVCAAFREREYEAYSCDIQSCSGGHPEWHIHGDVLPLLRGNCTFTTMDGKSHYIDGQWDLIIAHPPCTRLCNSGQRWMHFGTEEYKSQKQKEQKEGIEFFMKFVDVARETKTPMAIENPVGIMSTLFRKPDFTYHPYDFIGETESKKTCIWLFNGLQPLKKTQILPKENRTYNIWKANFNGKIMQWGTADCARMRSKTPTGVAQAMAEQWGEQIDSI